MPSSIIARLGVTSTALSIAASVLWLVLLVLFTSFEYSHGPFGIMTTFTMSKEPVGFVAGHAIMAVTVRPRPFVAAAVTILPIIAIWGLAILVGSIRKSIRWPHRHDAGR